MSFSIFEIQSLIDFRFYDAHRTNIEYDASYALHATQYYNIATRITAPHRVDTTGNTQYKDEGKAGSNKY